VSTALTRIGEKARKETGLVFTSLYHHITDVDNLRACYDTLPAEKAVGVDVTDNLEKCSLYIYHATRILFKWLNRRSQRKSYTWDAFGQALAWVCWPQPRVRKDLNPCRRAEAC